jgi:hypothetical protein
MLLNVFKVQEKFQREEGTIIIIFRRVDIFDFFFIRLILGSSSYNALRLVSKAFIITRHLEQVLKRPLLIL